MRKDILAVPQNGCGRLLSSTVGLHLQAQVCISTFISHKTCVIDWIMPMAYPDCGLCIDADYTIRMNFTTVPRTWIPINRWRHDVPIHYKVW